MSRSTKSRRPNKVKKVASPWEGEILVDRAMGASRSFSTLYTQTYGHFVDADIMNIIYNATGSNNVTEKISELDYTDETDGLPF